MASPEDWLWRIPPSPGHQAEGPLLNKIEMGNRQEDLEATLSSVPECNITISRISSSLSADQRTLKSLCSLYEHLRVGRREKWIAGWLHTLAESGS